MISGKDRQLTLEDLAHVEVGPEEKAIEELSGREVRSRFIMMNKTVRITFLTPSV
jgi:hypothetical protein